MAAAIGPPRRPIAFAAAYVRFAVEERALFAIASLAGDGCRTS